MGSVLTLKEMERFPFIFSDKHPYRLQRHLAFWASWWAAQSFLYSFTAAIWHISYFKRLPLSSIEAFFYLIPHMFLAYSLMYWAVPKFLLKGKYVQCLFAVILLFFGAAFISSVIGVYLLPSLRHFLFTRVFLTPLPSHDLELFSAMLAGLRGAITIGGMAAAIKLMKYWYTKEQRNMQLQQENVAAQLQLLKAQVHPHFLFNTLNNIYSYTHPASPVASSLVMGLSDMLRYMLYECNEPLVPLHKELKMLQDYMMLEQIRYNQQLDININIPGSDEDLLIAPLLLLPFVENSFKHGTSQVLEHPWISLHIFLEGTIMKMKLVNGKARNYIPKTSSGIGITNVKKRLELLYQDKYLLKIKDSEDVFVINLKLELSRSKAVGETKVLITEHA